MNSTYEIMKNRMTNGKEFLTADAVTRINYFVAAFEISTEEADELKAIAQQYGRETYSADLPAQIAANETRISDLEDAVAIMAYGGVTNA